MAIARCIRELRTPIRQNDKQVRARFFAIVTNPVFGPDKKDALGASKKRAAFIGVLIRNDATVAGRSVAGRPLAMSAVDSDGRPLAMMSNLVGQTVKLHFLVARVLQLFGAALLQKRLSELKPTLACKRVH
ncbi:hypothetical protein [Bradyrhizobium murdochi]|uniref:hypothetical protein n=1 Tax=Bradyrhizobium murdochi TaxID=1038859 RepID=UPI00048587E4|nr:hypothetical protein [Bradyrhizobium murdochi]